MVKLTKNRHKPEFVAAKLTDKGYIAAAIEYQGGFIVGRLWLDLLDMDYGVTQFDIYSNNFSMRAYCGMINCKWIPKEQFDDRYERHCETTESLKAPVLALSKPK